MSAVSSSMHQDRVLEEGERVGRFLILRDWDGVMHAVAAGSVAAVCQVDDGSLVMLPGGRLIQVARPLGVVLAWLDGR